MTTPAAALAELIPEVVPQRYEESVPLAQLHPHPANPNEGDVGLISELLAANGFVGSILAQESTGIVIDGEHRLKAAQAKKMPSIPVMWLDVDDDTRDRLLASLNEAARRSQNNETKLIALLSGLANTPRGLEGAAFDGDDLDEMISRQNADERPERGDLLAVAGLALEPDHHPAEGQVWGLGNHRLAVVDLYTGWEVWAPLLEPGCVFLPYPTPLMPHSENLPGPAVMVQPDLFLAGHLLDKWKTVTSAEPELLIAAPEPAK